MKLLLVDNFDSFVYNIYQYLEELGYRVEVRRNNAVTLNEAQGYDGVVLSPGPGTPEKAEDIGIGAAIVQRLERPVLGVCLGHQTIVHAYGGRIIRAPKPMHGKTSVVKHNGTGVFSGVKDPVRVMRYHSLIGEEATLPGDLQMVAKSEDDGSIMAIRHAKRPLFGVQFHPESIMTEEGKKILKNFGRICEGEML